MALGILAKKITNAFKFHKEANGDMAKLKNDLINDGWKMTQDSTPVTQRMVSTPSTVDVIAPTKKYASIGTSQMRSGRSSTIQTSSTGLMSKANIGKKTLLGG
jgi:hypothetical protein